MTEQKGSLRVRTFTAGGALPVEGAHVRIFGADESNSTVVYSLITDRDGVSDLLTLKTPSEEYSLSPSPKNPPSAIYDIEISANGYFTKHIRGVSVFSGTSSIQDVNMIPKNEGEGQDLPLGNLTVIIPETNI